MYRARLRSQEYDETFLKKLELRRKRSETYEVARRLVGKGKFDSLIVATKYDPGCILFGLWHLLENGRPFAIYCASKELLLEPYLKLRRNGMAVNVYLHESWYRPYQVLISWFFFLCPLKYPARLSDVTNRPITDCRTRSVCA